MKKVVVFLILISLSLLFLFKNSNTSLLDVIISKDIKIVDAKFDNLLVLDDDLHTILNLLNLEIRSISDVSDSLIVEGYISELNNYVIIDNYKVNIQISVVGDSILIGYPLIYGSF